MESFMPITEAQKKATTKYVKNNYDRHVLTMPKGKKAELQAHAKAKEESLNGFVNRAIDEAVERDNTKGDNVNASQAVSGYLDDGRFTPHEAVILPRKAEVTLLIRKTEQVPIQDDEKAFWSEFDQMTAESVNENDLLNDEAFSRRDSGRDLSMFLNEGQE